MTSLVSPATDVKSIYPDLNHNLETPSVAWRTTSSIDLQPQPDLNVAVGVG
jgi:hypothetical protein